MLDNPILENVNISEIIMNSWNKVFIEEDGRLQEAPRFFSNENEYLSLIQKLCLHLDKDIGLKQAFVSGRWKDFRIQIISPHITSDTPTLCMRRIRNQKWTLNELQQREFFTLNHLRFLKNILHQKKNLLIIGPTGSGKTSFLSAMLNECEANERCILLEDTSELPLPNKASKKMLTFESDDPLVTNVNLNDLIKHSLRLRPDRLVVGEIRGEEAKNLILAMATGHRGSMGSMHAKNAQDSLSRLEVLIQMGAPQWNLNTIRRLIFSSFDYILLIDRKSNGFRYLKDIHQLSSLEPSGILLDPILCEAFG